MSTLATALAVSLAAGSAPAKVSGETRQRLDVSGDWQGTLEHNGIILCGQVCIDGEEGMKALFFTHPDSPFPRVYCLGILPVEEAEGRFRAGDTLGIYQEDGGCLRLCWRMDRSRPLSFHDRKGAYLLSLRRVKTRK